MLRRVETGAGAARIERGGRAVELTKLDRVLWPETGETKGDLVDYYRAVAPVFLPHVRSRPLTIRRHFTVPRGPFVWEKDAPRELPAWVARCPQPARSRGGEPVDYAVVDDELALLWFVEYGCIDFHVWSSRCDRPERPDYVVFDLDPAGVPFADVVRAALLVRDALQALELESVVRTTGGEGLHVLVPLARRHSHEEARQFARIISRALARAHPELVTVERVAARRHGVYVDAKMNGHGQQLVAPYSVRPVSGAPVATPLRWQELDERLDPSRFTMQVVRERVEREGDVHAALRRGRQRLDVALARLA